MDSVDLKSMLSVLVVHTQRKKKKKCEVCCARNAQGKPQLALHLPILKEYPLARIVLLARVLPETVSPVVAESDTEGSTRSLALYHNLALHQLTGGRDHERADVLAVVHRTCDADGVLVVTNEVRGADNANIVAFEIQYLVTALDNFCCGPRGSMHDMEMSVAL